jgi:hypothetical protein
MQSPEIPFNNSQEQSSERIDSGIEGRQIGDASLVAFLEQFTAVKYERPKVIDALKVEIANIPS